MFKNKKRLFLVIGFLAITLIYSLYNIFLIDSAFYWSIPRKIRHLNKLVLILVVYAIGTYALKKYTVHWMMQIWHLIHIVVILSLILIGVYDWYFQTVTLYLRNIANTLLEILISPMLYISIILLNRKLFLLDNTHPAARLNNRLD